MKKTLTIAALVATTGFASAASTYIDFATPGGSTSLVGGNQWNTISTAGPNALVDTANVSSGSLTLAFTNANADGTTPGFGGGAFNSNDTGTTAPAFLLNGGAAIGSAIGDGLFINDGFGGDYTTISFSGLAASTQYEFIVYGGRNDANFSNDALIMDSTGSSVITSYGNRESATFTLASDGAGALSFRFTEGENATNTGSNATMSGMSVTAVPEPSSTALLGLGGLALILRRRK